MIYKLLFVFNASTLTADDKRYSYLWARINATMNEAIFVIDNISPFSSMTTSYIRLPTHQINMYTCDSMERANWRQQQVEVSFVIFHLFSWCHRQQLVRKPFKNKQLLFLTNSLLITEKNDAYLNSFLISIYFILNELIIKNRKMPNNYI